VRDLIIAIDGPSGAGKGTIAREVAGRLGYRHVDTGAMYRAVAWRARQLGADLHDAAAVAEIARRADFDPGERVFIDGHDVTQLIRTPAMDEAAAIVARHQEVRSVLVDRQRRYGADGGLVMEGRDIGSVVFPHADVKVYLDASAEERARHAPCRRPRSGRHRRRQRARRARSQRSNADRVAADRRRGRDLRGHDGAGGDRGREAGTGSGGTKTRRAGRGRRPQPQSRLRSSQLCGLASTDHYSLSVSLRSVSDGR
jgi:cytidylate kinase